MALNDWQEFRQKSSWTENIYENDEFRLIRGREHKSILLLLLLSTQLIVVYWKCAIVVGSLLALLGLEIQTWLIAYLFGWGNFRRS